MKNGRGGGNCDLVEQYCCVYVSVLLFTAKPKIVQLVINADVYLHKSILNLALRILAIEQIPVVVLGKPIYVTPLNRTCTG